MKLPSQIAVFLLCILVVSGTSCPEEEEDVYPCTCLDKNGGVEIVCYGEGINQQDIKRALRRMDGNQIAELSLYHLQSLGKLKGDLFSGHHIRKLTINDCDLEALTDGEKPAFSGLEDSLQDVVISESLEGSHSLQLSHLLSLQELALFSNHQLKVLKEVSFPASLHTLYVSDSSIKSLPERALANLVNLQRLAITQTQLIMFKRSWLPETVNKLRFLELNDNNLTSLPRDIFSNMPALITVHLDDNGIRTMEPETWKVVWENMFEISMRRNPLVCDSNMEWIRQVKTRGTLFGTCHEPADLAGVDLREWMKNASH